MSDASNKKKKYTRCAPPLVSSKLETIRMQARCATRYEHDQFVEYCNGLNITIPANYDWDAPNPWELEETRIGIRPMTFVPATKTEAEHVTVDMNAAPLPFFSFTDENSLGYMFVTSSLKGSLLFDNLLEPGHYVDTIALVITEVTHACMRIP